MSRFYDALKGFKPSDEPPQENAEAAGLDNLHPADVASILATFDTAPHNESSPRENSPVPGLHAASPIDPPKASAVEDIAHVAMPSPLRPIPSNGSFGKRIQMRLDRRIRLIPHLLDSMNLEQYRFLRTRLLQHQADQKFRTLLVTSPRVGEGKTLTTLNLALTFAMLPSFRVLVVEGDLRKGMMQEWLGIQGRPGLENLIEGSATLEEVVCKSNDIPVSFVVRGSSRLSPAELLHSPQVSLQLQEMAKHFDLVLVDSPPVNLVADAQLLAASCEAVLLVVRACFTSEWSLEEATKKLQRFRVLGTVLNGAARVVRDRGYDYYKD